MTTMTSITATELARDTRRILDLVNQRRISIEVRRNQAVVARIEPVRPTMTAEEALAGLVPDLTLEQGAAWLRDSRGSFSEEVVDPWA